MKTLYCKIHKKTKLIKEEYHCYECQGDSPDFYCSKCYVIEEEKRLKRLRKTCNTCVNKGDVAVLNGKIVGTNSNLMAMQLPHSGKPLKKGDFATINTNGILTKCKEDKATYFVIN